MARPGTEYSSRDAAANGRVTPSTGTLFVADVAASGPVDEPVLITNATNARAVLGADIAQSTLAADLERAFSFGLKRVYFVRVDVTAPADVTDADRIAALDKFPRRLGSGQVFLPGAVTPAAQKAVIAHGAAFNRTPIIDLPARDADETLDEYVTTVSDAVAALRADVAVAEELGGAFVGTPQFAGKVPGSVKGISNGIAAAALMSRQDAVTKNPNAPAAGEAGRIDLALSVKDRFTEAQVATLMEAGVNVFTNEDGVQLYGYRTMADRVAKPEHWALSNARLDMAIKADADAIAKKHVFKIIDSEGEELAAYNGALTSMLGEWKKKKALFSLNGDAGFSVDTSAGDEGVNTPETIADGQVIAVLAYRRAPFAELVSVEHVVTGLASAV